VLGEHLRLGSQAVILSRTFHRPDAEVSFEASVQALRDAERTLVARDLAQVQTDALGTADRIRRIASDMAVAP
jgi:hypothetical protein